MERVMGFEPTASTLARLRSSQLSYTRKKKTAIKKSGPQFLLNSQIFDKPLCSL